MRETKIAADCTVLLKMTVQIFFLFSTTATARVESSASIDESGAEQKQTEEGFGDRRRTS
jgi:hypothetical protein